MLKTFIKLGSVTLLAQTATFVFLPFILRNIPPREFAQYSVIVAAASISLPFITLRLDYEIASSTNNDNLNEVITALVLYFQLCFLAISVVVLFLSEFFNFKIGRTTELTIVLIWLVINCQSLVIFFVGVAFRNSKTNAINSSALIQNYATGILQALSTIFSKSWVMLVISFVVGRSLGLMPLKFANRFEFKFTKKSNLILKNYLRSRKQVVLSGFIDALIISIPIFLSYYFISAEATGLIGLSQNLLLAPVTLIGGTLINSYFIEKTKLIMNTNYMDKLTKSIFSRLLGFVLLLISFEYFMSISGLLDLFVGKSWVKTQGIFNMLVVPFAIQLLASPFLARIFLAKKWVEYATLNSVSMLFGMVAFVICQVLNLSMETQSSSFHIGRFMILALWIVKKRFELRNT